MKGNKPTVWKVRIDGRTVYAARTKEEAVTWMTANHPQKRAMDHIVAGWKTWPHGYGAMSL